MKKDITIILLIIAALTVFPSSLLAQTDVENSYDVDEIINDQLGKLDLTEIERFISQIDHELSTFTNEISMEKIIDSIKEGGLRLNIGDIFSSILKFIFKEFMTHSALLGKLIVLAIICAVLHNLQSSFHGSAVGKLAYGVTYLVLITLAISSFTLAINMGKNTIEQMVTFVQALIPILLTMVAALGGFSTAAFIHPFMMVALAVITTIIKTLVFPLLYFYAALSIVSHISEKFRVNQLASLIKDVTMGIMMLCMTLFVGALGFQGVTGIVADSLTLRTAKFLAGSFIPVVGGMLADALEALVGTSLLLTNAIGLFGVVVIIVISIFPMIEILVLGIIYKLAGALVQPFGDSQIGEALQTMGKCINLVFAAVAAVALMFFIAVSIIIALGNVTVMMR
ncbi:MAG: stage III sporulation protein AE [Bacillota bacterium]